MQPFLLIFFAVFVPLAGGVIRLTDTGRPHFCTAVYYCA